MIVSRLGCEVVPFGTRQPPGEHRVFPPIMGFKSISQRRGPSRCSRENTLIPSCKPVHFGIILNTEYSIQVSLQFSRGVSVA